MKRLNRIVAGSLSLSLGAAAIWLAIGFYRTGAKLAPIIGGSPDYALVLVLGGFGATFFAIAYAYLFRKPKA